MDKIPEKITTPTTKEFEQMTDEQKRVVILQIQQNITFTWVKQAAILFVITSFIGILVTVFILFKP